MASQRSTQGTAPNKNAKRYHELRKKHLVYSEQRIDYDVKELLRLTKDVRTIVTTEPTLLEVQAPVIVVADIHGQYLDLHRLFHALDNNRRSSVHTMRFLFLGDYVDRGPNGLECLVCLFLHKVTFPTMFNLLRGNHETAAINRVYGFYQELRDRFEEEDADLLWQGFNDTFNYFPLAALVRSRILCMHGGIGPNLNSLDDIRKIQRPIEDPNTIPLACDLLWSDPMIDLAGYMPNAVRGVSVYFGEDTVVKACERLNINLIIRGHQMMMNGYGFFCRRRLLTLFSAPRYYPEKNNKGAVVKIDKYLKVGFLVLNPTSPETKGPQHFKEEYTRRDDDSSYVSRGPGDPSPSECLTQQSSTGSGVANVTASGLPGVSPDSGAFLENKKPDKDKK